MREFDKTEIKNMLQDHTVEPAQRKWAMSIVSAPEKNGASHFCVDYHHLNTVAKRVSCPKTHVNECIDSLGEATIFPTLDASSEYWQVEIDKVSRDKAALTSHHGLLQFICMPFGLRNANGTFQQSMDVIPSSVRWQYILVYFDNTVYFLKTPQEHTRHVFKVLKLLCDAEVTLRLKNASFIARPSIT